MKKCFKCSMEKDKSDFYKHKGMADGLLGKCKECTKLDSIKNRSKNKEYYSEYDKTRSLLISRKVMHTNIQNRYRTKHPDRRKASLIVKNALSAGEIARSPCFICGELKVEGHHPDYSAPLSVVWLCSAHHHQLHKEHNKPF